MSAVCYLIHFEKPLGDLNNPRGQAQHYLGWTDDLPSRIERHKAGNGSAIMAAVAEAGIRWVVIRTWRGDRSLERRLKSWHKSRVFCPICNPQE